MNRPLMASMILGVAMVMSAGAAKVMIPTNYLAKSMPALDLDTIIPAQIGDWAVEKNLASQVVNPQTMELINKLYEQTLTRTYANKQGERIMLSIAYGIDQRDGFEVHHPEICYPAQGFQVQSNRPGVLTTSKGNIAVTRLETNLGTQRYEPVTYWTTIGDKVISEGLTKKMTRLRYGFQGMIPDGLIFRVSSIDAEAAHAFLIQESFVNSLAGILKPVDMKRLMGLEKPNS